MQFFRLSAFCICFASLAPADTVADSIRNQRLAGLCKVWGAVKYFHPFLAEKQIDWDKALVDAIPKIESADSPDAYTGAINSMLSVLGDPDTRAVLADRHNSTAASAKAEPAHDQPYVIRTKDDIAIVVANDWSQFAGSLAKAGPFRKALTEAVEAKAIVLDLRNLSADQNSFWFNTIFFQTLPLLLAKDVPLASSRHRMYSGYPTQTGGGYRGYYGAFINEDASVIRAENQAATAKPIAIVIDSKSDGLEDVLSGLQAAKVAAIIQDGPAGLSGGGFHFMQVASGVNATIRTGEFVNPDGTAGFAADLVVPSEAQPGKVEDDPAIIAALDVLRGKRSLGPRTQKPPPAMATATIERAYADMTSPSKEYRLLALFRFYNVINYFYPYKHLFDRSWDDVLLEYIPKFEAAEGAQEYAFTVARLVSNIQDSHGAIQSSTLRQYLGTQQPPVEVKSIQGQTVITHIYDDSARKAGLTVGDVVVSVDGEEIAARRGSIAPLFAASTTQALRRRVDQAVLGGAKDSEIRLEVRDAAGKMVAATLVRSMTPKKAMRETPVYSVLPSGFGYIDLERLNPAQVEPAFDQVKETPALIFDMRGYPNGVFMMLASHFAGKETVVARFETPTPQSPDASEVSRTQFVQRATPGPKKYPGKVVVLINEEAISQSEHTCLILEATAHAKFIGSPTNGANGDVTQTILPGGITVNFSGHDVRHADGRQLQRLGIQPDVLVEPTIEGVRSGRDELLEKAIEYLKRNGEK